MMDRERIGVPDLRGETGRELHYTVPPGFSSAIHLMVEPASVCSVSFEDDAEQRLRIVADPGGAVRFHVVPSGPSAEIARVAVECDADGKISRHGIDLRVDHESTSDMPAPPEPGIIRWTDDTRLRTPLSMSEMLSVSDEELLERRYPVRPNPDEAPRAFEAWRRAVGVPALEVEPALVERPDVTHGLSEAGPSNSLNWSGFELRRSPFMRRALEGPAARYDWVTGTWHVPYVIGHSAGRDYSCLWIGLDGDDVSDLYQAGTEQDVVTGDINGVPISLASYYAWTEFLPQEPTEKTITGFWVEPGDEIFADVWIGDAGSPPKLDGLFGVTSIHNFRTGTFTFVYTDRGSTTVGGTEAEWIMERPTIAVSGVKQLPTLADYRTAIMSYAYARLADSPRGKGYVPYQGSSNLQKTMFDSAGTVLSTVRPLDTYSMEFRPGDPRFLPPGFFQTTRAGFP
jgi:Peptidase A4 family